MKLEISEKDRKLLIITFSFLILILAYVLGYQPFDKKTKEVNKEVETLQEQYDNLKVMYDNKKNYLTKTQENNDSYNAILVKFNAYITQPDSIMYFYNLEEQTGVDINQITMSANTDFYSTGSSASAGENTTNQTDASTGNGLKGTMATYNLTLTGTYDQIKQMLDYIRNSQERMVATSVSSTYDTSTDLVSCTLDISQYAIAGNDRAVTPAQIPDQTLGLENIFNNQ